MYMSLQWMFEGGHTYVFSCVPKVVSTIGSKTCEQTETKNSNETECKPNSRIYHSVNWCDKLLTPTNIYFE